MQALGGHLAPVAALVAGACVCQWLLGEIRFSSGKAETVFRVLFLAPAVIDAFLMFRRGRRASAAWRLWALVLPGWVVVGLMTAALAEKDAQGAIFIFMLPFGNVVMSAICYLITRSNSTGSSA